MTMISPFRIAIPDDALVDLRNRIARTRWPDALEDVTDWSYGTDPTYLRKLVEYWANGYDWRARERRLNELPQIHVELGGLRIHAFHVRSHRDDAIPLLLCHGWPGCNTEFTELLTPLANPEDPNVPAFHVVAPAMPGYGFSDKPKTRGMHIGGIAALWVRLLRTLGYERFALQGGDWGAWTTIAIARTAPEQVIGLHLNYVPARSMPAPGADGSPLTDDDRAYLERRDYWMREEFGYGAIQGTKPQSLAYAFNDSPVGLAGWIAEKFHRWTDRRGGSEPPISHDEILTNISIYWFTQTIGSSMRIYKEAQIEMANRRGRLPRVTTPTAIAAFPHEIPFPSRGYLERFFNITRWTEMPAGGHFAALEQPQLLLDDVRAFYQSS